MNRKQKNKHILMRFCSRLPIFLYIKPPDELTLADVLPDKHIWTEGLGGPKDVYLSDCNKLRTSTDMLYVLHRNLVERLMDNSDQTDGTPSSRKIFVTKLRQYVMENSLEHRVGVLRTQSSHHVLL